VGSPAKLEGRLAVVCGGSKGIGLAAARSLATRGASVCLVARDAGTLDEAAASMPSAPGQFVDTLAVDTTEFDALKAHLDAFVAKRGTPDWLVNCVGYSTPRRIEECSPADFELNMRTNYLGQLHPILALLPHFLAAGRGHIANCSSVAGYLGLIGYAAYTPTKYAIAGLSEALRHELRPRGIGVSILYPPDTDTPGFAVENSTKPPELRLMSEGGGLMSAQAVGEAFVKGILKNHFYITPGTSALLWRLARHTPRFLHRLLDHEYAKARGTLATRPARK
jgi:3-dehydrosphinganine reductase